MDAISAGAAKEGPSVAIFTSEISEEGLSCITAGVTRWVNDCSEEPRQAAAKPIDPDGFLYGFFDANGLLIRIACHREPDDWPPGTVERLAEKLDSMMSADEKTKLRIEYERFNRSLGLLLKALSVAGRSR